METNTVKIKKTKKKPITMYSVGDKLITILVDLILVIVALLILIPIIWILGSSFNPSSALRSSTPFPKNPTLLHYKELFEKTKFLNWYINTLKIATVNMIVSLALTMTTSYVFARCSFKGKKFSLLTILVLQMFPSFMGMIAMYNILWQINLLDSHWGLVLVYASGQIPYNTWLVKGYLSSIPKSLDEAAMIDGASKMQIFHKIILPLAKPIVVFVAISQFMAPWMDFIFPRLIISSDKKKTLAIGLFDLIAGDTNKNFTRFAAGAVLVAVPITILFMFFQKYFVEGLTAGANKG